MTVRDAFFLSAEGYRSFQARADRERVALDPSDLKRGDPPPLFGLPVFEDPRIPDWTLAIIVNADGGLRCAILPGGRIFLAKDPHVISLGGVDWLRSGRDPERVGVPCFLSLEAIEDGDALFVPDVHSRSPVAQARLKASAVDRILDFRPRVIGR